MSDESAIVLSIISIVVSIVTAATAAVFGYFAKRDTEKALDLSSRGARSWLQILGLPNKEKTQFELDVNCPHDTLLFSSFSFLSICSFISGAVRIDKVEVTQPDGTIFVLSPTDGILGPPDHLPFALPLGHSLDTSTPIGYAVDIPGTIIAENFKSLSLIAVPAPDMRLFLLQTRLITISYTSLTDGSTDNCSWRGLSPAYHLYSSI
jgi:hypothetical protein